MDQIIPFRKYLPTPHILQVNRNCMAR